MTKITIKHRHTGLTMFECDVPEASSGMAMRHALEAAVKSGANLSGADLSGANLSGANLSWANLSWANVDGEEITLTPISMSGLEWGMLITDGYLRIGCQRHTHAEWAEFSDAEIEDMSDKALSFWAQWKSPLLAMCEAHASKVVRAESVEVPA